MDHEGLADTVRSAFTFFIHLGKIMNEYSAAMDVSPLVA